MLKLYAIVLLTAITIPGATKKIVTDKAAAREAFTLLNDIRINTAKYYTEFPFLRGSQMDHAGLTWNDTLARAAEAKAYDMANRDYFGHVDPDGYGMNYFINKAGYKLDSLLLGKKSDNYFESLVVNTADARESISVLLVDKGVPGLGHRKHLLGMENWGAPLRDAGIGFARIEAGSTYTTYICVLIAKHHY